MNQTTQPQGKTTAAVQTQDKLHPVAFASGKLAEAILTNTIHVLALPIYSIGLAINPGLIGLAISLPRLWDGIIDPSIGHWSDNLRSRFGRRKPLMVAGIILSGLLYYVLWSPPQGLGASATFLYFLIASILFYTSAGIFLVPYYALGNELTMDANIRVKIMSYCSIFMGVAGLFTPWAYNLCFNPYFGANEIEGVRVVAIIGGSLLIITGMLPALLCNEKFSSQSQPKFHFMSSLRAAVQTKPLLIMSGVFLTTIFGILLVAPLAFYVGTYYVFNGDKAATSKLYGVLGSSWALVTIISSPILYWLIKKFDKKQVLIAALLLAIIGQGLQWFTFTPKMPYLSVLSFILTSPGVAALNIVVYSWLADVCDYDEYKTGFRREGIFSAMYALITKSGVALATFLSGVLIAVAGVDSGAAVQTPAVIFKLRVLFSAVPIGIIFVSILLVMMFPLNRQSMLEIRHALEERKLKQDCSS